MIYPSSHCIALIKHFEELYTKAYKDPIGIWTIGYGHTAGVKPTDVITEKAACRLLENDLRTIVLGLTVALRNDNIKVTQHQFDALASFAFNLRGGVQRLTESTLWKRLKDNDLEGAANQFLRWNKAKNKDGIYVVLKGLTRRREAERRLFLSGTGV